MQAHYIAVHKLLGASRVASHQKMPFQIGNLSMHVTITDDAEPYFTHIDTSTATVTAMVTGRFNQKGPATELIGPLMAEAKAKRRQEIGPGAFLIVEGELEIEDPAFRARRDFEDWSICIDDAPTDEIREKFGVAIAALVMSIELFLPQDVDRGVAKIADGIFLTDPSTGKPIYARAFKIFSPGMSLAREVPTDALTNATHAAQKVLGQPYLLEVASLAALSVEKTTTPLQAYVAAWGALEIFVNASFKAAYQEKWRRTLRGAVPAPAQAVVDRYEEVMVSRLRLTDKLAVIVGFLDPDSASHLEEFRKLKRSRDEFLHGATSIDQLPTSSISGTAISAARVPPPAQLATVTARARPSRNTA